MNGSDGLRAVRSIPQARAAAWLSYGYGLAVALVLGHFVLGLPVQVSDSFGHILQLSASWPDLLMGEFTQEAYMRPGMWAALKAVYDASGGEYTLWYRGLHAVQIVVLVLLYVLLVRPRTLHDAALVPVGLGVLFGLHTFTGTVREAFPINTYLSLLILCLAAANVALAAYRWWHDAAAALLFVAAALTVETGLLVWVVFVGLALAGATGVSRHGLGALVVLLAGYMYVRFGLFDVGVPGLMERSSGFGFRVLDAPELIERFGANPLAFYAYNVATSMASVLFSEPRAGVFRHAAAVLEGTAAPVVVVDLVSSAGVVLLLGAFAWQRRRAWAARVFDRDDRLVLLFGMVLAANAVISYPYTKDVIMSPAGMFLSAAVFAAARGVFADLGRRRLSAAGAAMLAAALVLPASAWALRLGALHNHLRNGAVMERRDWADVEARLTRLGVRVDDDRARSLMQDLQREAIVARPAPPRLDSRVLRALGMDE